MEVVEIGVGEENLELGSNLCLSHRLRLHLEQKLDHYFLLHNHR